jgi:hypothetical protein
MHFRLELRAAVADLSARGLKLAAKWAAEQLAGLRYVREEIEEVYNFWNEGQTYSEKDGG